jgi:hypothetical protein
MVKCVIINPHGRVFRGACFKRPRELWGGVPVTDLHFSPGEHYLTKRDVIMLKQIQAERLPEFFSDFSLKSVDCRGSQVV